MSCIPDSKTRDAGFHISQAKISWIPNPDSLTRGDSTIFLALPDLIQPQNFWLLMSGFELFGSTRARTCVISTLDDITDH